MNVFKQYLVEEFAEDYQEGHLSRREALKLLAGLTGSVVLANSILAGCTPVEETLPAAVATEASSATAPRASATTADTAENTITPAESDDVEETLTEETQQATIEGQQVQFPGEDATLTGYLSSPSGEGSSPVVLVCHENRGLTSHIEDVTRRLASAGYVALAVDLLSRSGGTQSLNSGDVPGILGNTNPEQFASDFLRGWEYLKTLPNTQPAKVGMVGFCFGGGVTWLMATRMPELLAAVPFYGPHPPVEAVPNIQAAVLGIYAGNDQRINQSIPAIEEAMRTHNKVYEKVIYPDVDHAFHNDTGSRYNAEAATDAWRRTLDWFERYVKS